MAVVTSMFGWALWMSFTRYIQLGLSHRSMLDRSAYTGNIAFAGVGAALGYWLYGVERNQEQQLSRMMDRLIAARQSRAEEQRKNHEEFEKKWEELRKRTEEAAK